MKLEVGQFVRFKDKRGIEYIRKITSVNNTYPDKLYAGIYIDKETNNSNGVSLKNIIKASSNIIGLIKSKDIILGRDGRLYQCWKIYKDYVFTYSKNKQGQTITLVDYQIDKILTKEEFEKNAYKVGE